jgi:membrane protein required for colicin V production
MAVPTYVGIIIDIVIALVLVFSFIGGLKQGAVKEFLNLLAFIIALSLTGAFTVYVHGWLGFIADPLWRDFFAFLATMGLIMIVLHLVFLLPRVLLDKVWNGGFIWNVLGGIFGVVNTALGLVLLVVLLDMYPVVNWLGDSLAASNVMNWLVASFGSIILSLLHMTGAYLQALDINISFYAALWEVVSGKSAVALPGCLSSPISAFASPDKIYTPAA